ncbi:MAG: macro domain-containing protein [Bacilli bacterium]|nr:macro domain-containing protein [Bacilli bacterium]
MFTLTIIKGGDIFKSYCQTIVNPINCVGIMGRGLALEFKNRYPIMFDKYKELCSKQLLSVGKLWIYYDEDNGKNILNFPTKFDWRDDSKYEYIELGLSKFVETYKSRGIKSIAFPMLGCGCGKLDKDIVLGIMFKYLSKCDDLIVEIYN